LIRRYFCILEWKPGKCVNKQPVVLVGKGIVYDTGGLNIKTGDYMDNMKGDMAGAANCGRCSLYRCQE